MKPVPPALQEAIDRMNSTRAKRAAQRHGAAPHPEPAPTSDEVRKINTARRPWAERNKITGPQPWWAK